MVMNNLSEGRRVSRGGGDVPLTKIRLSWKKVYHKVNKYLFDYLK